MAVSFKGAHFPQEIILMGIRWYVAYPGCDRSVPKRLRCLLLTRSVFGHIRLSDGHRF